MLVETQSVCITDKSGKKYWNTLCGIGTAQILVDGKPYSQPDLNALFAELDELFS